MKELGDVATQGAIDAAATLAGIKSPKQMPKRLLPPPPGDADGRGAKLMDAGHAPLINEGIWVAISFVVFVALVWKKAGAALAAMFDSRADEIRSTLEEARTLRDQAQSELKKYQKLNPRGCCRG